MTAPYPGDPSYLLDPFHQIDVGHLDPERPPRRFHREIKPRMTPNPASFDEAFRQIGGVKVGGGPKTIPADKFAFCGSIGSGFLILTSQVRLNEPNESFYTSSHHRLRDSHVGSGGHWVDIEVFGRASDEDLATIRRLAQMADTRTVHVRRSGNWARSSIKDMEQVRAACVCAISRLLQNIQSYIFEYAPGIFQWPSTSRTPRSTRLRMSSSA
ncbi:hypothetical protein [Aureimonas pseudogalii]|uniref:Uncharacterized protein n=1 Tax=Aureimonas pseudogalii TaxID=1744844 RepID=A0A7W6H769_9HYPH|nr:hypothetical protein [Aureimonas pseudogalii]MBB3999879.1 hypothetical protein [Aureimonas pseudogalii]